MVKQDLLTQSKGIPVFDYLLLSRPLSFLMKNSILRKRFLIAGLTLFSFSFLVQTVSAQCPLPIGLTTLNVGQNTASLRWTSGDTPTDNCWTVTLGGVGMTLEASGCPQGGQALFTTTVCYLSNVVSFSAPVTGMTVVGTQVTINVGGLPPGTSLQWYVSETCDGIAPPNNVSGCAGSAAFTTLDAQYTVGTTSVAPTCPFASPGYVPNGSFTVNIIDGSSCAGTYTVNATPVVGSGPAGSTPPATTVTTYIGFPAGGFLFANAGAGSYTVTVTETGTCNPPTDPVVIVVVVPNGTDNVQPTFYVTDVLGNILADNDPLTAAGTVVNFGNVIVPEGQCGRQDEYYVYGFDNCTPFIVAPNAVSATATTVPATIVPSTQVSTTTDGFGFYLVDVHWSTGTSTVNIQGRDASGNVANGASGLQLIMTIPDNIDPVVSIQGNTQFTIPVCATSVVGILTFKVDDLCDQAAVNFTNLTVSFGGAIGNINYTGSNYREYFVTFPAAGNYLISATYTDAFGNIGFIDQIITVQLAAANMPPVIQANAETVTLTACQTSESIIYSFTISDDCAPINIAQVQFNGGGSGLPNLSGAGFYFTDAVGCASLPCNSVYFEVIGNVGPASTYNPLITYQGVTANPTITVLQNANQPADIVLPSVNVTIPQCQTSITATFAVSIFDDCDNPVVPARAGFTLGGVAISPTFINAGSGYFEFTRTLTAANNGQLLAATYTDAQGLVRVVDAIVQVNAQPDNFSPVIVYPSQNINVDLDPCGPNSTTVSFQASAHDNCGITSWTVQIGGVNVPVAGNTYTTAALTPGTYTVTLTARDAAGNTTVETFQIIIRKAPAPATSLACIGQVNISLDAAPNTCRVTVTADMVLNGSWGCLKPSDFTVLIKDSNPSNGNIADGKGLFDYIVTKNGAPVPGFNSSCWGKVLIEDKLAPVVNCRCPQGNTDPACAFACTDEAAFFAGTLTYPRPIVTDNCTNTSSLVTQISDEIILLGSPAGCSGKIVRRTWVFIDAVGNKSIPCVADYKFNNVDVLTVTPPTPTVSLTCGADVSMPGIFAFRRAKYIADGLSAAVATAQANRDAWPTVNGVPLSTQVCNLIAAKSDTELPGCGPLCTNSKKIIRLWTILDWCNSSTRTITQIIKAVDEEAPTIQAKDITVSVDPWTCAANVLLPAPEILHDNCDANPTYTVTGPLGVTIVKDISSGRFQVIGAPKGIHIFTYIAKDCCGHEGTDEILVTVLDKTAPIAIAKQFIVISLTTGGEDDGIAKLFANSVDNGSYDSCTPVHLELRREDDPTRDEDGCGYTGNKTYNADGHPNDGSSNPSSPNYDPDNGAYVKFCCADITNREGATPFGIVKVWMRVWDDGNMSGVYGDVFNGQSDNYNETWVDVRVEDKLTPQIICPPTVTIDCDDDIHDLTITGKPRAFSNCLDLEVEYTDREYLNNCNVGYIDRTWRIKSRPSVVCVQRIYQVNPFGPFTEAKITWPADITTNCADNAALAKPIWVAGPCDVIGLSLKSDTFYFEGNACMKILNRWTIINWCTYNPNVTNSPGYFYRTQVIKVIDEVKPTLGSCADRMFEINDHADSDGDGNRCETRNLMLTQTATDQGQCSSDWLKWIVFVDLWGDGTNDYEYSSFLPATDATFNDTNGNGIKDRYVAPTGQGGEVKITLPEDIIGSMSNHKVTWKVVDGCGNVTSCTQNFMVVDKKKPTPYCLNISSALMQNGKVELWAVDFNLGSFDNCTSKANLLYTFNEANPVLTKINQIHFFKGAGLNATEAEYNAGTAQKWLPNTKSSGMIFDCGDLPSVDVKMTVWDEKLNFDFCIVTLNLADNQGACGGAQTTTVSGRLISNNGKSVGNAEIILDNGIAEMLSSSISTSNGDYAFPSAVMHYDYSISGEKNDDYLNGVSTLDLVMIQRHILSISKFTDPFNIIAADINNDEKITASDLLELRKLILGIYTKLPKNDSWRFINSAQSFADINSPWPFSEKINISNLSHTMSNQNFVGVKVGDVNGSAVANANNETVESRSNVVLMTENKAVEANTLHSAVFSSDIEKVYGLQFTLTLNNADLADVFVGNNRLSDANIAKIADNKYTVSWNDINAVNGKDILTVNVVSKGNTKVSELISMNSTVTAAEIYSGENLQTGKLSLRFAGSEDTAEFAVYQNEPNPFNDKTVITFNLPEAGNATLKVFDVTGQVIFTNKGSFGKGTNSFTLTRNDLPSTGVMIYQIESGAYTATKKMIGLE